MVKVKDVWRLENCSNGAMSGCVSATAADAGD